MKKALPVGVENFKDMVKSGYYYVDKTLLIKELLDLKGKVNLFTRPRRFGKSVAANMLAAYYNRCEDSSKMFENRIISQAESYNRHLNQYDVVKINMQDFFKCGEWNG